MFVISIDVVGRRKYLKSVCPEVLSSSSHTHTHTHTLSLHDDAVVYDIGAGGDRTDSAFLWIEVIVWFLYVLILF